MGMKHLSPLDTSRQIDYIDYKGEYKKLRINAFGLQLILPSSQYNMSEQGICRPKPLR